jgi:hypothetical protein
MKRIAILALSMSLFACGGEKKPEDNKGATPAAKPGDKAATPAAPAAKSWVKLEKMGLQIEVPAGFEAMDSSADAPNYMVSGNDCTAMVNTVTPVYVETFDAAKAEAQKDPMNTFKAFTKEEKTADGWILAWTAESSMDKAAMWGFSRRFTVDGKAYECTRNNRDQKGHDCTVAACMSVKKL